MEVEAQQEISDKSHTVRPPSPRKRSLDEANGSDLAHNTLPVTAGVTSSITSSTCHTESNRQKAQYASASMAPQCVTQTNTPAPTAELPFLPPHAPDASLPSAHNVNTQSNTAPAPPQTNAPNKKRKLTAAEKELKIQEKEEARKALEEEKKKREEEKEEEKRKREELKKKKEGEKEEERKKREEEKRKREEKKKQKEEERLAREEEKKKKERSQMRLNAFFAKPPIPNSSKTPSGPGTPSQTASHYNPETGVSSDSSTQKTLSDFENEFPPFFIQSHVTFASAHRFQRDPEAIQHAYEKIDTRLKNEGNQEENDIAFKPSELFKMIPYSRRYRRANLPTVREIVARIQDADTNPDAVVDLTRDDYSTSKSSQAQDLLKNIPMKILQFREDVRPPYRGTFSKRLPRDSAYKLCRNPFSRILPDCDYDYDSEAEWEEPEEGEDLDSEGEEDVSDDDEEDMADFLDDGEDELGKRKMIVGNLEPICTGLCWASEGASSELLQSHRMEILSETFSFPIDPFSDIYWKKTTTALPKDPNTSTDSSNSSNKAFLAPPSGVRPLSTASAMGLRPNGAVLSAPGQKSRAQFPQELLTDFKQAVSGSDLTKAGLIEILKKRFPKVSKEVIKETLTAVAVRQGQKEVDKRWILK
ncbi:chromatin assembly factor-I (CAF-I) p90 subunit [Ophidiomyces ophidiicola]|nr:chromatin assembly factor-I (CAF-I) p90 subunit [Ophidiomyces ophidiicola]